MGSVNERAAVGSILSTAALSGLSLDETTQVAWPNRDFNPPKPSEKKMWIRVSIKSSPAFRIELGRTGSVATHRAPGMVFLQVYGPPNTSDVAIRTLADSLAALFRDQVVNFSGGSVKFRTPTIEDIGHDGTQYQLNVSIPFIRDEVY